MPLKVRQVNRVGLGVPVGTITSYAGSSAPAGWILMQGQSISRATYPALFAVIGTTYGSADANSFNLPDLRGEFLRGLDLGRNVDGGRVLGSVQTDAMQRITGAFNMTNGFSDTVFTSLYNTGPFYRPNTFVNQYAATRSGTANTANNMAFDSSLVTRSAAESRPTNVALNFIVKF